MRAAVAWAVASLTLMTAYQLVHADTFQPKGGGSIQGVVTTTAKPLRYLRVTFDQKICGQELPDESIAAGSTGQLANVVVSLVGVKAASPAREISVVNDKCAFVPRVQVVGTRATLKTSSRDAVLHTTVVQQPDGRQLFNVALPVPGMELRKPLGEAGVLRVGCSTHQWMRGWVVVTDELAAVTGADGRFTLPNVPPGTYRLRVWHEALKGTEQPVTVTAGKPAVVNIELKP